MEQLRFKKKNDKIFGLAFQGLSIKNYLVCKNKFMRFIKVQSLRGYNFYKILFALKCFQFKWDFRGGKNTSNGMLGL